MFQESPRALDITRHHLPEQRRETRIHNQFSGTVASISHPDDLQMVALRDLNTLGAFFYSDLRAEIGDSLALEMVLPDSADGRKLKICCEGVVVRIEPAYDGASSGFAVQFGRYDISWVQ